MLRLHDPAELLAHVAAEFGCLPPDCAILMGLRGSISAGCMVRVDLADLLADTWLATATELMASLQDLGASELAALVAVGTGLDDVEEQLIDTAGATCAVRVAVAAEMMMPPMPVHALWLVGGGTAESVRLAPGGLGADGIDVEISPPETIAPLDTTLVAAQTVASGRYFPPEDRDDAIGPLRAHLAMMAATPVSRPLPRPSVGSTWRRTVRALGAVRDGRASGEADEIMTACERIRELVADLVSIPRRDELLALLVGRGQGLGELCSEHATTLMLEGVRRPHASICAGGEWFEALRTIELATRPLACDGDGEEPHELVDGWASLACVLALLMWWQGHRAASRGVLDEVIAHRPEHSLARLALALASAHVGPGGPSGLRA